MMMVFGLLPFALILLSIGFVDVFRRRSKQRTPFLGGRATTKPKHSDLDGSIFRLAKSRGGHVSLSEVVVETGLELERAEKYMDSMVDSAHVAMEVDKDGRLYYVFPELISEDKRNERTEGDNYDG